MQNYSTRLRVSCAAVLFLLLTTLSVQGQWKRHTIDNSSQGADGVRLADFNKDGLLDIVTGWEEGGRVRVCINPGHAAAKSAWPAVTVGNVKSPEDAVGVDLDGDGQLDVVTSCEGRNQSIYFHWAPANAKLRLQADAWKTTAPKVTAKKQAWMFALPLQVDGKHGLDLIVGSKNSNASISWLESPANPRDMDAWKLHPICKAGWIMSLVAHDMDLDGDLDVLASDRKGSRRGIFWLENPGAKSQGTWTEHRIRDDLGEVMFLHVADFDKNQFADIACAVKGGGLALLLRTPGKSPKFKTHKFPLPAGTGSAKGVAVGDIDGDGQNDLVFSCEHANGDLSGVRWGRLLQDRSEPLQWKWTEVSGPTGVKYDIVELLDLDGDGDLDIVTCEERANLGVFWYENPR